MLLKNAYEISSKLALAMQIGTPDDPGQNVGQATELFSSQRFAAVQSIYMSLEVYVLVKSGGSHHQMPTMVVRREGNVRGIGKHATS